MTKTALITGTSKGLGLELARALLADGHQVIGVARGAGGIEDAHYHHLQADVTGDEYPRQLQAFVEQRGVRRIELLINNAGSEVGGLSIAELRLQDVRTQFNLHCVAALATVQATLPLLKESKIVNITSRLGSVAFNARGDFAGSVFPYSYRIGKCAQNMLSICMAQDEELAGNIIIALIPGLLRTDCGPPDATHTAADGAAAALKTINAVSSSGLYHAFGDEAKY